MKNKYYINNKIKQKILYATQKLKEEAQNFDYGEDVREIFAKMRESLKVLRKEMIDNIQKRIENNIAQVRAELYHTKTI